VASGWNTSAREAVPELPDIVVYQECLERRIGGARLVRLRLNDPFLLRTAEVPVSAAEGQTVRAIRRIGKRIVVALENEVFLVFHLMIAGRLHWRDRPASAKDRATLAAMEFAHGHVAMSESGSKRRASLHIVRGEAALAALDPGGVDVFAIGSEQFAAQLRSANRTLKRALTDPHLFSGIGNAYSDEILHRARLSPFVQTAQLSDADAQRLHEAVRTTLGEWIERLRVQAQSGWPLKVTAFHPAMAVHGKYGRPCPVCAAPVQRIVYAGNETNYCARCQTGGKILADRTLSRLLKASWPRSIDELG
jgi:formamidopyrimidine-DNA glycosylase